MGGISSCMMIDESSEFLYSFLLFSPIHSFCNISGASALEGVHNDSEEFWCFVLWALLNYQFLVRI